MRFSHPYIVAFCFLFLLPWAAIAAPQSSAQEQNTYRQPTPEETARKHTEMLVRDLNITDSALTDTIYRIHLKYAILRQTNNSRAEHLIHVQQMYDELQQVLSKEQYDQFMNQQLCAPRRPHAIGRMSQTPSSPHTDEQE